MATNVEEFISDLDGGQLSKVLNKTISDIAMAVKEHEKVGKINISLSFRTIPKTAQVSIEHSVSYERPNRFGKSTETLKKDTPMFVCEKTGQVTLLPGKPWTSERQGKLITERER